MAHPGTPMTARRRRAGWVAHVLAAVAIAVAGVVGLYGVVLPLALSETYTCIPDFSEDTIIAPASYRGLLLCGVDDGELTDRASFVAALLGLGSVLLVLAVVTWIVTRRVVLLTVVVATLALVPGALVQAVRLVPADCTSAQRAAYGADGCERHEENRPGIGTLQGDR